MSGQFSWPSCLPIKNHYTTKYNKNANNNVINSVFFIGTSKRVLKHILLVEARTTGSFCLVVVALQRIKIAACIVCNVLLLILPGNYLMCTSNDLKE